MRTVANQKLKTKIIQLGFTGVLEDIEFIKILASEPLAQRLWIVEEGRIRIRR